MGFSFAAIRKDLASERFRKFYRRLKTECPELLSFPDHDSLLLFFHDETQDLDRKDTILAHHSVFCQPFIAPFIMIEDRLVNKGICRNIVTIYGQIGPFNEIA